jgi:hypothetical protein
MVVVSPCSSRGAPVGPDHRREADVGQRIVEAVDGPCIHLVVGPVPLWMRTTEVSSP